MSAPLDDITVIAIDSWMAAPSAAAILADMGATVIKIEPPSGDPMRDMGRPPKTSDAAIKGYDFQFDVDNRGKQSIQIDLTQTAGIELVRKLVASADVFLCNLLAERQQKYQLDFQALLAVNPRLVHATLTGYGTSGPDAWRPGYDVTAFFGRSGLYDSMREGEDGIVPQARPAQGDHTTGLALVAAILAALRQVEKTGNGEAVETSLYETAVWTQATDYSTTAVDTAPVRRRARHEMLSPTANRYPCGDGKWVVFNMPEPRHWPLLCKALGREEWLQDPAFETPKLRYQNMADLTRLMDEVLATRTRDEWGEIFDREGMIWGPVLTLDEVAKDPQADAIGMFPTLHAESIGEYRTVNIPLRFSSADVRPRHPAPALGQDTSQVLAGIGLNASEITALKDAGVIQGE